MAGRLTLKVNRPHYSERGITVMVKDVVRMAIVGPGNSARKWLAAAGKMQYPYVIPKALVVRPETNITTRLAELKKASPNLFRTEPNIFVNGRHKLRRCLDGVDAVMITTPHAYTVSYLERVLDYCLKTGRKLQVMVEKPLCPTAEQVAFLQYQSAHPVYKSVVVGCQLSNHVGFEKFLMHNRGFVGRKYSLQMRKWQEPNLAHGGVWQDLGPHVLAMCYRLGLWPLMDVSAEFEWYPELTGIDYYVMVTANTPKGWLEIELDSHFEPCQSGGYFNRIEIKGERTVSLDFSGAEWTIANGAIVERYQDDPRQRFLEAWLGGRTHECLGLSEALEHAAVIEGLYQQAMKGGG